MQSPCVDYAHFIDLIDKSVAIDAALATDTIGATSTISAIIARDTPLAIGALVTFDTPGAIVAPGRIRISHHTPLIDSTNNLTPERSTRPISSA